MENSGARVRDSALPLRTQVWYGAGYLPDSLLNNAYALLVFVVYDGELRLGAAAIGLVGLIIRLWDALNDPLIGNLSDRTRSRWGRRHPYIAVGAVAGALCTLLLWNPPTAWDASALWWYLLIGAFLYYTAFSIYSVPYFAMGLEMSTSERDRDGLMGWRVAANNLVLCAMPAAPMLIYNGMLADGPADSLARLSWILAGLILASGLLASVVLKAPRELPGQTENPPGLIDSFRAAYRNRALLTATGIVSLALLALVASSTMLLYMNLALVFPFGELDTRKEEATRLMAITGFAGAALGLAVAPVVGTLAAKFGRKAVLSAALTLAAAAFVASPWLFRPDLPLVQLALHLPVSLGVTCVFVLTAPMIGEVCDMDEIEHGTRREGTFAAIFNLGFKISIAVALFAAGVLVSASGFSFDLQGQSAATLAQLKLSFVLLPALCIVAAFLLARIYPLDADVIARFRLAKQTASASGEPA